jgi:carotenoid cleavage dioxygenase-like enzyme
VRRGWIFYSAKLFLPAFTAAGGGGVSTLLRLPSQHGKNTSPFPLFSLLKSSIFLSFSLGAKSEDDGVLMSVVFDGPRAQSYLLLLDAVSMEPLARAYLPHNIPWSAHGLHFPEAWPLKKQQSAQSSHASSKEEL